MLAADRDALLCDLAETYGIYDFRQVPVQTLAILASGLRENARIRQKLSGVAVDQTTLLLASCVDALHVLIWAKTKDGQHGRNRPKSIANQLLRREEQAPARHCVYQTPEAFRAALQQAKGVKQDGSN